MVKLFNLGSRPFDGWLSFTIPNSLFLKFAGAMPEGRLLRGPGFGEMAVGQQCGQARVLWLHYHTQFIGRFDLTYIGEPTPGDSLFRRTAAQIVAMAEKVIVRVNGQPLRVISGEQDGPALVVHYRGLVTECDWADVIAVYVPGETWARYTLSINAALPSHGAPVSPHTGGFQLTVAGGLVYSIHSEATDPRHLIGWPLAKGQGWATRGVVAFGNDAKTLDACHCILAGVWGIDPSWREVIGGMGVPTYGNTHANLQSWCARNLESRATLEARTIRDPFPETSVGITARSSDAGDQEEQSFGACGAEVFAFDCERGGEAAEIRLRVALGYWRRPCHWREESGDLLRLNDTWHHVNLGLWDSRPDARFSRDMLGLERVPTLSESYGWYGADREHWFYGSLFLSALLTGDRCLQMLLEAQVRIIAYQERTEGFASLCTTGASRSIGWYALLAMGLYASLKDRKSAEFVLQRTRDRTVLYWTKIAPSQPFDIRTDVGTLVNPLQQWYINVMLANGVLLPGPFELAQLQEMAEPVVSFQKRPRFHQVVMMWQLGWCGAAAWMGGKALGLPDLANFGLRCCEMVVLLGYTPEGGGTWQEWDIMGIDGFDPAVDYQQGRGVHASGFYDNSWMAAAPWALLAADAQGGTPVDPTALAKARMIRAAHPVNNRWVPPALRQPTNLIAHTAAQ